MKNESNIIYKSLLSPLGFDLKKNIDAIYNGDTGLKANNSSYLKHGTYTATIEEEYIDSCFSKYGNPKYFSKLEKLSILSISDVIKETGIDPTSRRSLLIYATTKGNIDLIDSKNSNISEKRVLLTEFKNVLKDYFGFAVSPIVVSNACISGVQAIILANDLIKNNTSDDVIVVGGDLVSRFTLTGFSAINAISTSKCRPFDTRRDGINLGECCAAVALSSTKKSTTTTAKILSSSSTSDAHHIVAPSREGIGLTNAIKNCLKENEKVPIDFISAHGTATRYNDEMEALSIHKNGLEGVPISSIKEYYGHTLGAAGILETVISLEAIDRGILVPLLTFESLGVTSKINVIEKQRKQDMNCFLKTASGFGGCNTAVVFQKIKTN